MDARIAEFRRQSARTESKRDVNRAIREARQSHHFDLVLRDWRDESSTRLLCSLVDLSDDPLDKNTGHVFVHLSLLMSPLLNLPHQTRKALKPALASLIKNPAV
jgi:hypothetical protein